jgi:hypothetical protein
MMKGNSGAATMRNQPNIYPKTRTATQQVSGDTVVVARAARAGWRTRSADAALLHTMMRDGGRRTRVVRQLLLKTTRLTAPSLGWARQPAEHEREAPQD